MSSKDAYATLGLTPAATQREIRCAYVKLARRHHPDLNREPDAEAHFKGVVSAYESLLPQQADVAGMPSGMLSGLPGHADQHARVQIELRDTYRGSLRTVSLSTSMFDAEGRMTRHERQLEVKLPKGVRHGQHLRLVGQGTPASPKQPAGDLYLEIEIAAHPDFRVDDRDVYTDLPLAPWDAALGALLDLPTPDGRVQIHVPAGSQAGQRLRLQGLGLPATPPGDLYAVLSIVLPPADTAPARDAYRALAMSLAGFDARPMKESD